MTLVDDKNFPALQYLIADSIHSPEGLIGLAQRHTDKIIAVDKETAQGGPHEQRAEADALITNLKGVLLSITVADCVPLLFYDRVNGAVGAAHAGWRGTFAQIGPKTVRRMGQLYGSRPADIRATIGPAIGVCCYEVDADFYARFRREYGEDIDAFFVPSEGGSFSCSQYQHCQRTSSKSVDSKFGPSEKPHADLKAMNQYFLTQAGIPEANIEVSKLCTQCEPALFYSHRRSGERRGAMAAFIGMK